MQNFLDQVRRTKEEAEQIIKIRLPKKLCSLNDYLDVCNMIWNQMQSVQHELLKSQELPKCDVSGETVECNEVLLYGKHHEQNIMVLNAQLKEEMIYYLDIYDVLQYDLGFKGSN